MHVSSKEELAELINTQPILCLLLYTTNEEGREELQRMASYTRSLAKEYVNKAVMAQVNVSDVVAVVLLGRCM